MSISNQYRITPTPLPYVLVRELPVEDTVKVRAGLPLAMYGPLGDVLHPNKMGCVVKEEVRNVSGVEGTAEKSAIALSGSEMRLSSYCLLN